MAIVPDGELLEPNGVTNVATGRFRKKKRKRREKNHNATPRPVPLLGEATKNSRRIPLDAGNAGNPLIFTHQ